MISACDESHSLESRSSRLFHGLVDIEHQPALTAVATYTFARHAFAGRNTATHTRIRTRARARTPVHIHTYMRDGAFACHQWRQPSEYFTCCQAPFVQIQY